MRPQYKRPLNTPCRARDCEPDATFCSATLLEYRQACFLTVTTLTMADFPYDEFADEFGLDDIETDEQYFLNTESGACSHLTSQHGGRFAQYSDIEDFDDEIGISSCIVMY